MPPATTHCSSPALIAWAASMTALSPEPQTLFTVIAGIVPGRPAWIAAWRAGAWPTPPWSTFPMITSSTSVASMPARRTASRITRAPSFGADSGASPPRYLPMGVRTALRMTGAVSSRDMRSQGHGSGSVGAQHAAPLRSPHRFKFPCQFILTTSGPGCEPLPRVSPRSRQPAAPLASSPLPARAPLPSPPPPRAVPPRPYTEFSAARCRGSGS